MKQEEISKNLNADIASVVGSLLKLQDKVDSIAKEPEWQVPIWSVVHKTEHVFDVHTFQAINENQLYDRLNAYYGYDREFCDDLVSKGELVIKRISPKEEHQVIFSEVCL